MSEANESSADSSPRIYVACLAAYNNGKLHGAWIDATLDPDDIQEIVNELLKASPEPDAEEWAIHDYENFQGIHLGEYESWETVSKLANLIEEHGGAFAAFWDNKGADDYDDIEEAFQDAYVGEFDSLEDYAWSIVDDLGILDNVNETFRQYFDAESFGRDLELGGDIWTARVSGTLYIFRSI